MTVYECYLLEFVLSQKDRGVGDNSKTIAFDQGLDKEGAERPSPLECESPLTDVKQLAELKAY